MSLQETDRSTASPYENGTGGPNRAVYLHVDQVECERPPYPPLSAGCFVLLAHIAKVNDSGGSSTGRRSGTRASAMLKL